MSDFVPESKLIQISNVSDKREQVRALLEASSQISMNELNEFNVAFSNTSTNFVPGYWCLPEAEIYSNWRIRYIKFEVGEGRLLATLKYVAPPCSKPRHFILTNPILPLDEHSNTFIDKAYSSMLSCGVDGIVLPRTLPIPTGMRMSEHDDCNYYNTLKEASKMMSSKWRSKHGINLMSKFVRCVKYDEPSMQLNMEILDMFKKWKEVKGDKGRMSGIEKTLELLNKSKPSNWHVNMFFINNTSKLCGFMFHSLDFKQMFTHTFKHCAKFGQDYFENNLGLSKEDSTLYKNHIGDYMTYVLHMEFMHHIDSNELNKDSGLFYFGLRDSDKGLKYYKEKTYKHKVEYVKCVLNA